MKSKFQSSDIVLAPSSLSYDNLTNFPIDLITDLKNSNVKWLHCDIMDGLFVDNKTNMDASHITAIKKSTNVFIDVHLMVKDPLDFYIDKFANFKSDLITIHYEIDHNIKNLLLKIKDLGIKPGLAVSPNTRIESIYPYLDLLDLVLIMTVNPGLGGQELIKGCLNKAKLIASEIEKRNLNIRIQLDGGVNESNAIECIKSGADTLVCGSSFAASRDKFLFEKNILNK